MRMMIAKIMRKKRIKRIVLTRIRIPNHNTRNLLDKDSDEDIEVDLRKSEDFLGGEKKEEIKWFNYIIYYFDFIKFKNI